MTTDEMLAQVLEEIQRVHTDNEELRQEVRDLHALYYSVVKAPPSKALITSGECQKLMGWKSYSTLVRYRQSWLEGVHYFPQGNQKTSPILYSSEAVQHWQQHHQTNPDAHRRYCEDIVKTRQAA